MHLSHAWQPHALSRPHRARSERLGSHRLGASASGAGQGGRGVHGGGALSQAAFGVGFRCLQVVYKIELCLPGASLSKSA